MLAEATTWLERLPLHETFSDATWFVPAVQTIHILGIAVVVTTLSMLNVRLLRGAARDAGLSELSARFMPWTWAALAVLLCTGILLIITEPRRELMSVAFQVKMLLVLLLIGLARVVQVTLRREQSYWDASSQRRKAAVAIGVANLLLCAAIVAAGRLIAYMTSA